MVIFISTFLETATCFTCLLLLQIALFKCGSPCAFVNTIAVLLCGRQKCASCGNRTCIRNN